MTKLFKKANLVGADPGPSTSDQGHTIEADSGPVVSGKQERNNGACSGPLLPGDQGQKRWIKGKDADIFETMRSYFETAA